MALANLTEQEIVEVKEMFSLFDTNHDGRISQEEFGNVFKRLGYILNDEELQALVREIDYNRTGAIELTEFINIIESRKESIQLEDAMREAFDVFDQDQNGYIDRTELKSIMHRLGNDLADEVIDKMIKDADKDGDGRIDFEEFTSLWNESM